MHGCQAWLTDSGEWGWKGRESGDKNELGQHRGTEVAWAALVRIRKEEEAKKEESKQKRAVGVREREEQGGQGILTVKSLLVSSRTRQSGGSARDWTWQRISPWMLMLDEEAVVRRE